MQIPRCAVELSITHAKRTLLDPSSGYKAYSSVVAPTWGGTNPILKIIHTIRTQ